MPTTFEFYVASNRVIVGYGNGALVVIDPATRRKVSDMLLKAHPESFQIRALVRARFLSMFHKSVRLLSWTSLPASKPQVGL